MSLTKSDFLKPGQLAGPFAVEGLGEVYIRKLPFSKTLAIQNSSDGGLSAVAWAIIASVCEADYTPVFTDDDYDAIFQSDVDRIEPLVSLVTEHSGLVTQDTETVLGNSDGTAPSDSGTA